MNFAQPREEYEKGGPNSDEENHDEDEDFPVLELTAPQERPIRPV